MTFNFLGPGLTVNVEAKVKEQIILDSSAFRGLILSFKTYFVGLSLNAFPLRMTPKTDRTVSQIH